MTSDNADQRSRQASGTTSDNTEPVDAAALTVLADRLAATAGNLNAYIAAAADRIAGPRIAAAETAAAAALAQQRREADRDRNQAADLRAELGRQLDAQLRTVAELRWAAQYLPAPIRHLVLADPFRPGAWAGDRPTPEFADRVTAAAAAAGLTSYPDSTRLAGMLPNMPRREPDQPPREPAAEEAIGAPFEGGLAWHYFATANAVAGCRTEHGHQFVDHHQALPAAEVHPRQRCTTGGCQAGYAALDQAGPSAPTTGTRR